MADDGLAEIGLAQASHLGVMAGLVPAIHVFA